MTHSTGTWVTGSSFSCCNTVKGFPAVGLFFFFFTSVRWMTEHVWGFMHVKERIRTRERNQGETVASHPKEALLSPRGNCITYWSVLPVANGHRGGNCWWQLGNRFENNKESLRHKTLVIHLKTFHLPSHKPFRGDNNYIYWGVNLPKQWVHRLRRAFVSITAFTLANKQGRQTIILHYIHDYSTLHFLSA